MSSGGNCGRARWLAAMASTSVRVRLRPMTSGDMDAVMINETRCYAFPWTLGIFEDCLAQGYECWLRRPERPTMPLGTQCRGG